jgi:flagellar biosynthetic protein FlhB
MAGEFLRLFRHFLGSSISYLSMGEASLYELGLYLSLVLARTTLPAVLFIGLLVYISLRIQVGKLWTTKVFSFKLSRFNILAGLKRMLISPDTLVRLLKSLLEALFIGLAPVLAVRSEMDKFAVLYYTDAAGTAAYLLDISAKMVTYALVPMLIIAAADLIYTRRQYAENLKMSKDEIKDERKQAEGDEKIKAAMKSKMLKMSRQRMLKEVPKADVVITNPTHIAVALRYNAAEAPAPVVVAMGVDRVAEKIKEIARQLGVPVRENKELARALYKQTEIGDVIPPELFQAVAVILAQIWKTKNPGKIPKP